MTVRRALLIVLLLGGSLWTVPVSCRTALAADSLSAAMRKPYLPIHQLRGGWRFSEGDDSSRARPEYDDSAWTVLDRPFPEYRGIVPYRGWTDIGWFRLKVDISEDLKGTSLALLFAGCGAAELYVDGVLSDRFGRVGRTPHAETAAIVASPRPRIVQVDVGDRASIQVAVRFSNHTTGGSPFSAYHRGFNLGVLPLAAAGPLLTDVVRNRTLHQVFFGASFGAISLLHFLFFSFQPSIRRNLIYALYAGCLALSALLPGHLYVFVDDPTTLRILDIAWKWAILLTTWAGPAFLYDAFLDRPPRLFRWFPVPLVVLGLLAWALPLMVYYAIVLASFLELIRVVIAGHRRRKEGSRIIGAGFLFLIASASHVILVELGVLDQFFPYGYLYGFLFLALSIALFQARSFARTSRALQAKVAEVRALSDRRVDQVRRLAEQAEARKEAERRRRVLEAENAVKREEIEASRRRQEMLARLEQTTQQIRETQGQLLRSEKMAALGNLVAGIAHEINTPVGAINSMHDTLHRAVERARETIASDPEAAPDERLTGAIRVMEEATGVISSGTTRVTDIVRSLRMFARMDDAEMRETDLHEGLDNTIPLIQHRLRQGIEIVKAYGEVPLVTAYPSRLNQVFLNLLVNAIQAIPGEGTITIATETEGQRVKIRVTDTGEGISAEDLPRVFDPGFTTKGVGVGTGLGLSICYQIVKDHGGDIEVDSTEGAGTTVTITLPLTERED